MKPMKKVAATLLIAFLVVPILAGPADAWRGGGGFRGGWRGGGCCWGGGFALGLGVGALLTAPLWYGPTYAYPYPAYTYSYPTYSYAPAPAYTYGDPSYTYYGSPVTGTDPSTSLSYGGSSGPTPTPEPLTPPPAAQPGVQSGAQSPGQSCMTVTVEAHYETRILQNGQRVTAWIPAYSQQVCQ